MTWGRGHGTRERGTDCRAGSSIEGIPQLVSWDTQSLELWPRVGIIRCLDVGSRRLQRCLTGRNGFWERFITHGYDRGDDDLFLLRAHHLISKSISSCSGTRGKRPTIPALTGEGVRVPLPLPAGRRLGPHRIKLENKANKLILKLIPPSKIPDEWTNQLHHDHFSRPWFDRCLLCLLLSLGSDTGEII